MAHLRSSESPRGAAKKSPPSIARIIALAVFGLMAVGGPLSFGAVDRLPQMILLALLVIGMIAQPPAIAPLSRWGNRLALAFVVILLVKEFAPAGIFGPTLWRTTMVGQLQLQLPFTHHPEPGRAVEGLLSASVGLVWFLWVRRLSSDRENRPVLAWILLSAAAIVALVSFATRNPNSEAIFGLRYSPGWMGFGPFPNRNHSADFFAMGAILGCGAVTWSALQKQWALVTIGIGLLATVVVALLVTESRGGLIAFAVGLALFLGLCLAKFRNRRALAVSAGALLVFGGLGLGFGSQVFARFHSKEGGSVSNETRVAVWHDALGMWRDAPLFGHGLNSFASVFPLYEKVELENQAVIHPESSWLQWLTELGLIPVLIATLAGILFLSSHLRESFTRQRTFFLQAAGFSAGAVLLVHSIFDVPAHRWGTAGFALAAIALACPMRLSKSRLQVTRKAALIPAVVGVIWLLPLVIDWPRWSTTELPRLLARQAKPPGVSLDEVRETLRYFPLNADLHQSAGLRLLRIHGKSSPDLWKRHLAIAARLQPSSWYLSSAQARAVQRVSIGLAMPYWEQAIERGGMHREEVMNSAIEETGASPIAMSALMRFVESHPQLLLAYAKFVPEVQGPYFYGRWWKLRGQEPDLSFDEVKGFYGVVGRWGTVEQFKEWVKAHPALESRDFRAWAAILHAWKDDATAWPLFSNRLTEPEFSSKPPVLRLDALETAWRISPQNFVNAQQLAQARRAAGDTEDSEEVILTSAARDDAPPWFLQKAAYIEFRRGHVDQAVALMLRLPAS